jgi:hypothetical protein
MTEASDIYATQWPATVTYADPVSETPLSDIFSVASRPILAGNMMDEGSAREEAIDARIAKIKAAGGEELENPERGGYAREAARIVHQRIRDGDTSYLDRGLDTARIARQMYEAKEAELAAKHGLQFGDIGEDAAKRLKEAQGEYARAMDQPVNSLLKYGAAFAGGLLAQRRDPLFLGSLFAGPASATGRTALARMASSALNQGLFNAGLSAMEQPAVQAWREKTGQESGVWPAIEDVGLAFAMGAIPGAAFQGVKEAATPLRRLMTGRAERGDFAAVKDALGPVAEPDVAAMRAGEESIAATEALTPERPADVPPALHDDLAAAALQRADDPEAPSPQAVAAVREAPSSPPVAVETPLVPPTTEGTTPVERLKAATDRASFDAVHAEIAGMSKAEVNAIQHEYIGGREAWPTKKAALEAIEKVFRERSYQEVKMIQVGKANEALFGPREELQARIEVAAPTTEREAMQAADEALDDFGRRDGAAQMHENLARAQLAAKATPADVMAELQGMKAKDAIAKAAEITGLLPEKTKAAALASVEKHHLRIARFEAKISEPVPRGVGGGDREAFAADLVRSCK